MAAFATLISQTADLIPSGKAHLRDTTQDGARTLDAFLISVERKAFKIAQFALRHEADALDVVQDAMLQLSSRYASRPADEWRPLFYRILENRIRDLQRRRSVRDRVMSWLPFAAEPDGANDPLATAVSPEVPVLRRIEIDETMSALQQALAALPRRQQQVFLLRTLEGLDVAQTAHAMGCSQGSVKTHYFRALRALRAQLGDLR